MPHDRNQYIPSAGVTREETCLTEGRPTQFLSWPREHAQRKEGNLSCSELDQAQRELGFLLPSLTVTLNARTQNIVCHSPTVTHIQAFSRIEWAVLLCLLRSFPRLVTHAEVLAHVTGIAQHHCMEQLDAARRDSYQTWRNVFRPAEKALERVGTKVQPFDLIVVSKQGCGYSLLLSPDATLLHGESRDTP